MTKELVEENTQLCIRMRAYLPFYTGVNGLLALTIFINDWSGFGILQNNLDDRQFIFSVIFMSLLIRLQCVGRFTGKEIV